MVYQRYVRDPFYSRLGQEIVKQFRLSRVAQRFVPEREFSNSSKSALSHEQHGSCAEFLKQIWELLARKLGTCTKTDTSSKACEKFFRPQSRTCQENVVASRSDCEDRNREPFVDSGATLHMSKTTSLLVERTIRKSRDLYRHCDLSMEGSAEEATAHVNDVDAFVTLVLLEDSRAAFCLGLLCADVEYSCAWKKGELPSLSKDGNITVCKSGNNVPMVAGSKELRIPDNRSKELQTGRIRFRNGFNLLNKASLVTSLSTHTQCRGGATCGRAKGENIWRYEGGLQRIVNRSSIDRRKVHETKHKQTNWQAQCVHTFPKRFFLMQMWNRPTFYRRLAVVFCWYHDFLHYLGSRVFFEKHNFYCNKDSMKSAFFYLRLHNLAHEVVFLHKNTTSWIFLRKQWEAVLFWPPTYYNFGREYSCEWKRKGMTRRREEKKSFRDSWVGWWQVLREEQASGTESRNEQRGDEVYRCWKEVEEDAKPMRRCEEKRK